MDALIIKEYLLQNCKEMKTKTIGRKFINNGDFCATLCALFDVSIPKALYEQAVNGEGNEIGKIDSVSSSSLQALLIFSQVDKNHPISILGDKYTEVHFEYKNAVITFPSSVDVVLTNEKGKFLFIESKLSEIIDSSKTSGSPKVGPEYLSNHVNSYHRIGLEVSDLKQIGIMIPNGIELYACSGRQIKRKLKEQIPEFADMLVVEHIEGNKYVYSEGIKQMLAHIIGITNVNNPDRKSDDYLKDRVILKRENTVFLSVYNAFPGFNPTEEEEVKRKLSDYRRHEEKVAAILQANAAVQFTINESLSYQTIFVENKKEGTGYFDNMQKVVAFYHLNEEGY